MNKQPLKKILIALFVGLALLLAACSNTAGSISVEEVEFDFGDVVVRDVVSKDLIVTNTGSGILEIESIATSCGCTSATLDSMSIPAGETTVLHITFDSGAHGDVTGFVKRQVYIASNDPTQPEMRIDFTANVILKPAQ